MLTKSSGDALKHDENKPDLSMVPTKPLEEAAFVFMHGERKYGRDNWKKGMQWSRLYSALLRHLFAWYRKEGPDYETGKSHLAHALCCLLMLMEYERNSIGEDNR